MFGLRAGQPMTSTSRWSKKAAVSRAVWGGALSWTYTKLRRRDQYLAARSHLRMVWTDIHFPNRRIICIRRRGAEMKRFILTLQSSWRSSRGVEIFIKHPRFLWCGRPVSRLSRKILLMHPWDTPSILAISCWELPSADSLTIRCSICSGKFCGMVLFKSSKKNQ